MAVFVNILIVITNHLARNDIQQSLRDLAADTAYRSGQAIDPAIVTVLSAFLAGAGKCPDVMIADTIERDVGPCTDTMARSSLRSMSSI